MDNPLPEFPKEFFSKVALIHMSNAQLDNIKKLLMQYMNDKEQETILTMPEMDMLHIEEGVEVKWDDVL